MNKIILRGSALFLNAEKKLGLSEIDYIMLNLPFECNYNCLKCCNRFRKYKKGNLTYDKIKNTILDLKKFGPRVLVIAGEDEPTLNKNFRSIIKLAYENDLIPYVFTNGSQIDQELAKFLSKYKVSLIINVDSMEPEKYDQYVGVQGAFKQAMNNLEYIKELYKSNIYERKGKRVGSLAINLVLNNENYTQIPKLKKLCGEDIVLVVNEPIMIGRAKKLWDKFAKTNKIKLDKDVSYPLGTLAPGNECSYMRNGISIGSDGQVLTCAYALDSQGFYGSLDINKFLEQRKVVMESVDNFYNKFGKSRCILRHPQYEKFIKSCISIS
ncbi:MAG: radical SAM protein [Patescibacteria group bacterium]|nr:radical SAM protein [Patescibacteria group bacterium]